MTPDLVPLIDMTELVNENIELRKQVKLLTLDNKYLQLRLKKELEGQAHDNN